MSAKESPPGGYRRAEAESRGHELDSGQFTRAGCQACGSPADAPAWATVNATIPPAWRLIYAFVLPSPLLEPTREEKIDAARWFATTFGDQALARALKDARRGLVPHGTRWDPLWDRLLADLRKAGIS